MVGKVWKGVKFEAVAKADLPLRTRARNGNVTLEKEPALLEKRREK